MSVVTRLQDLMTVIADATIPGRVQDMDEWVDTGEHKVAVAQVEYPQVSGCTLMLQGCDTVGGEFVTLASFTEGATAACLLYLNKSAPYDATDRLTRFLRWKVLGSGAWTTTFQMTLTLK